MNPGRVLHVVWEYPPVVYGGLARHAEHLARAQHGAGLHVTVVTAAEDVTDPGRRVPAGTGPRHGVQVHRARRPAPRTPWQDDLLGAARELDAALTATALGPAAGTGPPDVVHGHDWTAFAAARVAADAFGVPLVMTVHATEHGRRTGNLAPGDEGGVPAAIHARERAAVAAAGAVVVCSRAMSREAVDVLGADPARVHVVPNAVTAAAWRAAPAAVLAARRRWADGAEPLVVAAGRIEWEKGFSTLVRAIPGLRAAGPVRVVIAGRGSEVPRLLALADELGVSDSLQLPGWLSGRDLAALYAAADAVVVPSRYEPSGLVAREAQAAGATVVATAVGGLAETVADGVTGLLIGVGDVHGLRDALLRTLADPAAARAMGAAAARAVQGWTWDRAATATTAVYAAAGTPAEPVTA